MLYVMTDQAAKKQMLEELRQRSAEIEAAIQRLEEEPVLLQPQPDF
jgi:cell division protein FtsB